MTDLALYTFAYRAKLNGRSATGTIKATNSTHAIELVRRSNELLSNITVRVANAAKSRKTCSVG